MYMFHWCFLSGGVSVPLNLSKSRIVEALCILLCQKYPDTQMTFDPGKIMHQNNPVVRSLYVGGQRSAYLHVQVEGDFAGVQHDC